MFLFNFWFYEVSFSREYKPLFILIGICFMKRHVWRVTYFMKSRYVLWKCTYRELVTCFMKRHMWRVSYFFIKQLINIEISSIFLNSHQKILKNSDFKFSLRKFQNLNFHFMKPYSPNSTIIIITYPCIYLYIQQILARMEMPIGHRKIVTNIEHKRGK